MFLSQTFHVFQTIAFQSKERNRSVNEHVKTYPTKRPTYLSQKKGVE
jgi:hypothetical protein